MAALLNKGYKICFEQPFYKNHHLKQTDFAISKHYQTITENVGYVLSGGVLISKTNDESGTLLNLLPIVKNTIQVLEIYWISKEKKRVIVTNESRQCSQKILTLKWVCV